MNDRKKFSSVPLLLIVATILSYIFTSMTVWSTDGKYLFLSRYLRINQHERVISGENFAPDQYRFGSYYLVEYFFKYIPIPWLDENTSEVSKMLLSTEYWTDEARGMVEAYFPLQERERIVSDLEVTINEAIDRIAGKSILLQNALKAMVSSLNWQTYITEPASTLLLLGENLPDDLRVAVDLTSEDNRTLNGHITARFFFNILTILLLYAFGRHFLTPAMSLFSVLLFQSIMPLTTMYFGWETFHAAALFLAGLLLIIERRSFITLCMVILLGSTFRADHMVFLSLILFGFNYERYSGKAEKFLLYLKALATFAIPVVFTLLSSRLLYPQAKYSVDLVQLGYNLNYPWSWIFPLLFLSIPLIFYDSIGEEDFFRKTWFWIVPFVAMNFIVARPAEVRLLIPVLIYTIPIAVKGLSKFFPVDVSKA